MPSPYAGAPPGEWSGITRRLVEGHPLSPDLLVSSTIAAWNDIFNSRIGSLRIGVDIFPEAQAMGLFLHHLIPEEIAKVAPGWRRGRPPSEKDAFFPRDPAMSIEIKTSSHPRDIFGNRSYAQPPTAMSRPKDGYYLAVNFGRFGSADAAVPAITRIRFGWLDHTDWVGQNSQTGQRAHLTTDAKAHKLVDLL